MVDDFQYLGSYIATTQNDLKQRKEKAWGALWKLRKLWSSTAELQMKIDLFKASVLTVFLYGSESWIVNKKQEKQINAFQTTCLRIILDIKREDHVSNEEVYRITGLRPLYTTIIDRQLRFLGHSLRRPKDDPVSQYALYTPHHGKTSRGRPNMQYVKYISHLL